MWLGYSASDQLEKSWPKKYFKVWVDLFSITIYVTKATLLLVLMIIRDVMSHSFGDGYATRSDEEGFGGVYSDNQSLPNKIEQDQLIHENNPAYDKTQGSEVKEKERARHQPNA